MPEIHMDEQAQTARIMTCDLLNSAGQPMPDIIQALWKYHAAGGQQLSTTIVPSADGSFGWLFFQQLMPGESHVP